MTNEHICQWCFELMSYHDEECWEGEEEEPHHHWPALCCPQCPCRSFREAHPEFVGA